jgi:hypothetical protein
MSLFINCDPELCYKSVPFGIILFRAVVQSKSNYKKIEETLEEFVKWFNLQVPDYTITTVEAREILQSFNNSWKHPNNNSN